MEFQSLNLRKKEQTRYINKTQTWHKKALSLFRYTASEEIFLQSGSISTVRPFKMGKTELSEMGKIISYVDQEKAELYRKTIGPKKRRCISNDLVLNQFLIYF